METDCLYPPLPPLEGENFRLHKISDIEANLKKSINHYRATRLRYARIRAIIRGISLTTGSLSVVFSVSGVATSATGLGLPIGVSLGGIGGFLGLISAATTTVSKRLNKRVTKHGETVALARAKLSTIHRLVSKALLDGKISDEEFQMILDEAEAYETLRLELREKKNAETPDLTKLKAEIRAGVLAEMREKIG